MNQMTELFQQLNPAASMALIHKLTVYSERKNNNRRFEVRYFGADLESVIQKGRDALAATDKYRSPSLSSVQEFRGSIDGRPEEDLYSVVLSYYSAD